MALQVITRPGGVQETVAEARGRLPALGAEALGTFILTLSGTATLLASVRLGGGIGVGTQIAVSVAFGFGILAAVYTVATVSGAHINPAVTFGLAAAREFPWRLVPAYWAAQLFGGIMAALMNWWMNGDRLRSLTHLGATAPGPGVSWVTALFTELVLTAVLLVVVMSTAVYERAPGGAMPAGLAIGLWIGTAVFLAFPISGGSLNPARSLGPDIVSAAFPSWWVYLIGPLAGGALGGWIWQFLKKGRQPDDAEAQTESEQGAGTDGQEPQRRGRFVVRKGADGQYEFTLVAGNGQVIATSGTYEGHQAALNGIETVKRNAPTADIDDPADR
jgi:MIP family channel proteins